MTKIEFLDRLDYLLSDLPDEERMNAVWYYEDYFAEAGEEQEEAVLRELGSPEVVAQGIRTACREKSVQAERSEEYDSSFRETTYRQDAAAQQNRYSGEAGTPGRGMDSGLKLLLIILIVCTIGFPIIAPIVIATILVSGGLFIGFGIGGVAMIAGGVAIGGFGITSIGLQAGLGLLLLGVGLIVAAVGLLLLNIALCCGFRVIPAVIRGIVKLIRSLAGKKEERHETIY